jgi:hypothetical protein
MFRRLLAACSLSGGVLLNSGCNGTAAPPSSGGPSDAGSGGDGAAGVSCPAAPPANQSPCEPQQEMIPCEYGSAWWDPACDAIWICPNGHWTPDTTISGADASFCSPKPGPNPAACPSSMSSVPLGQPCTDPVECHYGEGPACYCGVPPLSAADAGATWNCYGFDPACPSTRPRLGTSCGPQASNCCFYYHAIEGCIGGVWRPNTCGA